MKKKKGRREAEEKQEAPDETAQADRQTVRVRRTHSIHRRCQSQKRGKGKGRKRVTCQRAKRQEHDGELQAANIHNAIAAQIVEGRNRSGKNFRMGPLRRQTLPVYVMVGAPAFRTDSDPYLVAVPGSGATPPTPPRPTLPGLPFQRSLTGVISTENAGLPAPHILNLAGPPSMALEGTEKHPRKKRRRKRKTKKPQFLCTLNTYENGCKFFRTIFPKRLTPDSCQPEAL
jgi:hypothetical protein